MMKHEFEALAGYEVSVDDYNNIIEPMYMATNLNKIDFVKCISKKRFALKPLKSLVKEMKKIAEELKATCTFYTDYEKKEALDALIEEYIKRKYGDNCGYYVSEIEKFTCYYPHLVEIYNDKSYVTYEKIVLV